MEGAVRRALRRFEGHLWPHETVMNTTASLVRGTTATDYKNEMFLATSILKVHAKMGKPKLWQVFTQKLHCMTDTFLDSNSETARNLPQ